jgi:glycine oxidase
MLKGKDVIIVGAGVTGCSIAYHLARRGIASLLIDRESIGARASGKAWARIGYPHELILGEGAHPEGLFHSPSQEGVRHWLDLYWYSYVQIAELGRDIYDKTGLDIEYAMAPVSYITFSERTANAIPPIISKITEAGGHEFEWWDNQMMRQAFPLLNPDIRGGITLPNGQVEAYKYTLGLAQAAEKMVGAEIKQGDVVGLRHARGKVTSVKLASGAEIEADAVVLTMGPWGDTGAAWLDADIQVEAHLEQCLIVRSAKPLPLHCIYHGLNAVMPKVNGDVIVGRTMLPDEKKDRTFRLSETEKMEMLEAGLNIVPELENARIVEHRGDLMCWGPPPVRHKPVLGKVPGWDNAYVASRIAFGFTLSVGVGTAMAALIATGEAPFNMRNMMKTLSPANM